MDEYPVIDLNSTPSEKLLRMAAILRQLEYVTFAEQFSLVGHIADLPEGNEKQKLLKELSKKTPSRGLEKLYQYAETNTQ